METVSKLYKVVDKKVYYENDKLPEAIVKTDKEGKFQFEGVVPGYYYIRFTYGGNGTDVPNQKIVDLNGNVVEQTIKAKDYKSTIIKNDDIKEANKKNDEANTSTDMSDEAKFEMKKTVSYWYKKAKEKGTNFSTAVDDMNQRSEMDELIFKADGKAYKQNGDPVDDYETKKINAHTPMLGISIENDDDDTTEEQAGTDHKNEFTGFNLGLIKQPDITLIPEKKITNVEYTNQVGTTLISGNPKDKKSTYLTALDNILGGSKYAKIELQPETIYGSKLEVTYEISITNDSKIDYDSPEYYKYGEAVGNKKKVSILEVRDDLDEKYNYESITKSDTTEFEPVTEEVRADDGTVTKTKYIKITGWDEIASEETTSKSYTVTALIGNADDDPAYTNAARIQSLKLDKLTTFKSSMSTLWEIEDTTVITITPNTGENRNVTYYIVGAVALVVLAGGIVLIKRKVM